MLGTIGIWSIINTLVICAGIAGILAVVGFFVFALMREDKGRPLVPWGARMRAERAKAHTLVLKEHLEQDALEVKRLALAHQHDLVLEAIKAGDESAVQALGLPSGNGRVEEAAWR